MMTMNIKEFLSILNDEALVRQATQWEFEGGFRNNIRAYYAKREYWKRQKLKNKKK